MKLKARLVRTDKSTGRKFYRHEVSVPWRHIFRMGWNVKDEFEWVERKDGLLLRKKG